MKEERKKERKREREEGRELVSYLLLKTQISLKNCQQLFVVVIVIKEPNIRP